MKKPWSEAKKSKILSLLGTMPVDQVASQMGLTEKILLSACSRYGWSYAYKRKSPERVTNEARTFIIRNAGKLPVKDMADRLNIPAQRIRSWASNNKISLRLPSSLSVHTRIPGEDVELIRSLHDEGLTCGEIARKFEISREYCWQLCSYMNRIDC